MFDYLFHNDHHTSSMIVQMVMSFINIFTSIVLEQEVKLQQSYQGYMTHCPLLRRFLDA